MKKLVSLSIGIPARNEAANIKFLLNALLSQKQEGVRIKEIIVASDGSTDTTVEEIERIGDKRIHVIQGAQRKGKSYRLNQIFKHFSGDVLFIMDADISIEDNRLFSKIIHQANFTKVGMVGVKTTPVQPHNLFEKILETSVFAFHDLVRKWNNGGNYLAFKGCFLGFEKTLAKSIRLPEGLINDDAFMYFFARKKGYAPCYLDNIQISYKVPATFADHLNQSSRFQYSKEELQKYFSNLENEYKIPTNLSIQYLLTYLYKNPLYLVGYMVINLLTKLRRQNSFNKTWESAYSTKQIYYG
jgi:glycosyltransferase involved in cell wall biosynthesis